MNKPEEITDIFTPEGITRLKKGQLLVFHKEGKRIDLKITKIANSRVWAMEIKTYSEEEMRNYNIPAEMQGKALKWKRK